ncbi:MAG: sodium-dependent transporter [Leptospirales bacterium]
MEPKNNRGRWSSKMSFIMAAAGSAVGLGNLWKFPYIAWNNGGGLFILIYLVAIVLVGLPIMIAEITMGKLSRKNPVGAFRTLSPPKSPFRFVGLLGILTAFIILSYYAVVAGWGIQYSIHSIQGKFYETPKEQIYPLLASEDTKGENLAFVKRKAFEEGTLEPLSDVLKEEMLIDAGIISIDDPPSSETINREWKNNREQISLKLQSQVNLEKWHDYFYSEKQISHDYISWIQKTLLPVYSVKLFVEFVGDPIRTIGFQTIIMLITMLIVIGGVGGGIEKFTRFFMPLLFFMMILLVINSLMLDNEQEGVRFMLFGDPGKLNQYSFLEALGHAFFTLSLGMGAMMTYGSYTRENSNVVSNAIWVTALDTIVALLACLMIFPIIFSYGLDPKESIGILFTTLPLELFKFKGGNIISLVFYCLVLLAAITSAISLLEVVVAYLIDEWKLTRKVAALTATGAIYLLGIGSAVNGDFLEQADALAMIYLLPIGGFLIAIFAGYQINFDLLKKEFTDHNYPQWSITAFRISIRYITPCLVILVMLTPLIKEYWH